MIQVIYSPANRAYLIMWNESVLAIKNTKADAIDWLNERGIEHSF